MSVKKIKQKTVESYERLKERSAESIKKNYTEIKAEFFQQITGKEAKQKHEDKSNFTPFDDSVREKMGDKFGEQDQTQLDEVRRKLAEHSNPQEALRRQFDILRKEEREAIDQRKQEEMERKQKEEEEELKKKQEEQQQHAVPTDEPGTKQKRGGLFAKKKRPQQTTENRAGKGKQ